MKKILGILMICLSCWPSAKASAVEIIQMGHVEALGTYTEIKDSESDRGVDASGYYSPIIKFNDTFYIIPLIDSSFNSYPQYLPQDEGNTFYNTYLVNNIHVAARKEFSPGWFFKLTALGTWNLVQETPHDDWGDGLYDYYDVGASAEIRRQSKQEEFIQNVSSAIEYYRRTYPNFQSLISLTTVTPPEVNEKDYDRLKYSARMERGYADSSRWYVEPYAENKFYVDKHTINEDGTLNLNQMRFDYGLGLNVGTTHVLPAFKRISISLDGNYTFYDSNMTYYDSRNTVSLSDDKFTPDYYNYNSFNAGPAIEYAHPFGKDKAARLRFGYDILYRIYTGRKALTAAGDYTDEEQIDRQQNYTASLNLPITKSFKWITNYTYTHTSSNQEFQTYYRYTYDSFAVKSGFSYDF